MTEKKLRFSDVMPRVRLVFKYGYTDITEDFTHEKYSYTYRVFVITKGICTVSLGSAEKLCEAGDAVFLRPGQKYSTVFHKGDFECINIAFDFSDGTKKEHPVNETVERILCMSPLTPSPDYCSESYEFTDLTIFNTSFTISGFPCAVEKAQNVLNLTQIRDPFSGLRQIAALCEFIADLAEHAACANNRGRNELTRRILDYIDEHYHEGLTYASVAAAFSYHPSYINRIIRSYTGCSLHDYITRRRIQEATRLLVDTDLSMTEIAYRLSFCDSSHFSKVYFEQTGFRPTDLRRRASH